MGEHDGGIDHQPVEIGILAERLEKTQENAALDPIIIAMLDCIDLAKALRQIAPART